MSQWWMGGRWMGGKRQRGGVCKARRRSPKSGIRAERSSLSGCLAYSPKNLLPTGPLLYGAALHCKISERVRPTLIRDRRNSTKVTNLVTRTIKVLDRLHSRDPKITRKVKVQPGRRSLARSRRSRGTTSVSSSNNRPTLKERVKPMR